MSTTMSTESDPPPHDDALLLRRIRKLLDKAAGTSNPHEADAFNRKAAELIAANRVDPARLAGNDDQLDVAEVELGRGAYVRARLALLMAVAEPNDVRVVFTTRESGTVALAAGYRNDLDVVTTLYSLLHAQAAAAAALRSGPTGAATQRDRRSFLFGFAERTRQILLDAATARAEQSNAEGGAGERGVRHDGAAAGSSRSGAGGNTPSHELALAARRSRVDEFAAAQFGRVRTASRPAGATPSGFAAGQRAANHADVGRTRLRRRPALGPGG